MALAFFFALSAAAAAAGPLYAQRPGQLPDSLLPDSLRPDTLGLDTLTARGAANARIRELLNALARAPGAVPDSVRLAALEDEEERLAALEGGSADADFSDDVTRRLLEMPGYRVVTYSGAGAEFHVDDEVLLLFGGAGIRPDTADRAGLAPDSLAEVEPPGAEPPDTAAGEPATPDTIQQAQQVEETDTEPGPAAEGGGTRASMRSEGYRLEGEQWIRMDLGRDEVQVRGDPTYTPAGQGDPVRADSLNIDLNGERASAFGANTEFSQTGSAKWRIRGDMPEVTEGTTYGHETIFTSCELDEPHYHFQTNELKIVRGQTMVARPVRFYIADVPIAWLPFFAQSLATGRASGLLTPTFSANDVVRANQGYRRRISNVGYYWAMSEYSDATVAIDWFDDRFFALTGSTRYRWARQFLEGELSFRRFWRENGATELALDTNHSWEISETTAFDMSASFASSADFVRENSFDPREVTRDIRSQGGLSKQFPWGSLQVSANRQQSLASDRVRMTLPSVNLSLRPLEFFSAPRATASWYNNLAWNGSARFSRSIQDNPSVDTLGFSFRDADTGRFDASVSSSFSLGDFSFSQNARIDQSSTFDVPVDSIPSLASAVAEDGLRAFETPLGRAMLEGETGDLVDIAQTDLSWSLGLNWTKNLVGSTTFTPRLSINGRARRSDTVSVAQSFVSGPTRVSFGARFKADVYGFFPGFGDFEAIRHKISPQFTYDWSPAVVPDDLQRRVFGSREIQPRSVVTIGLNQTWEAKRPARTSPADSLAAAGLPAADSVAADSARVAADSIAEAPGADSLALGVGRLPAAPRAFGRGEDLPRRGAGSEIVNLLSLSTNVIEYDFVEADSAGQFLQGFTTTRLQTQISSDFLRGLSVSMSHDLFDDRFVDDGSEEGAIDRRFDPHLATLNLSFSMSSRSEIFRWLGLGGDPGGAEPEPPPPDDFYAPGGAESSIVPVSTAQSQRQLEQQQSANRSRGWSSSVSYALNRPREGGPGESQMLRFNTRLNPTEHWSMSWSTSYDLLEQAFNDHRVRLTRELHRWQAHFDFLQTATGNWSFRFEVQLMDNQDLKFDYKQQSLPTLNR